MKKIMLLLLSCISIFALTSCGHIEDSNGPDNYTVVTITDEDILRGGNSHMSLMATSGSSIINGRLRGEYNAEKFSGVFKVGEYDSDKKTININVNITCESGNAMVVVVSDDRIIKKIEANQNFDCNVDNTYDDYIIYVVGESAKLSVKYQIGGLN